jgi:hypothetical protein
VTAALAQAAAALSQALDTKDQASSAVLKANSSAALDQVSSLLHQVLAAVQGGGKGSTEASQQKPPAKETSGKVPYCYRCLTKGHRQEECFAQICCDICKNSAHNTDHCPKFRETKPVALACGYAVDGLGFFHVPHVASQKQKTEAKTAVIKVIGGLLSAPQIIAELDRLVSNKWKWEVQELGAGVFKTQFPSRSDLERMIEWGVVQTKYKASMQSEERSVGKEVKQILPKVWVQFTGLPRKLRE